MNNTSADDARTQAVFPESILLTLPLVGAQPRVTLSMACFASMTQMFRLNETEGGFQQGLALVSP
jgi:hypothetical protein